MTLADKINLIELMDNTTITATESGYTIETIDGSEEAKDAKALEDWLNYQIAADPGYYYISLLDWYKDCSDTTINEARKHNKQIIGFKIFDNISGENLTDLLSPAVSDWQEIKVADREIRPDTVAVYVDC